MGRTVSSQSGAGFLWRSCKQSCADAFGGQGERWRKAPARCIPRLSLVGRRCPAANPAKAKAGTTNQGRFVVRASVRNRRSSSSALPHDLPSTDTVSKVIHPSARNCRIQVCASEVERFNASAVQTLPPRFNPNQLLDRSGFRVDFCPQKPILRSTA